jgi:hypothetical protein
MIDQSVNFLASEMNAAASRQNKAKRDKAALCELAEGSQMRLPMSNWQNEPTEVGRFRFSESKRERHDDQGRLLRIGLDLKAEISAHVQHRRIFLKHLAVNRADSLRAGICDDQPHQLPAEPMPLLIGANQDGEFRRVKIRIAV